MDTEIRVGGWMNTEIRVVFYVDTEIRVGGGMNTEIRVGF
jgi:hypothetical protein